MARHIILGPTRGEYQPDYQLAFFRDGDPHKPVSAARINLQSLTAISTSKAITDISGTFSITLKDGRARHVLREMDTVRIRLRGHGDPRYITVFKGVVDDVRAGGEADPHASSEDTVITGRCAAKYLQVTSLFLPVWNPDALLPTALTFGLGDAAKKVGSNRPYDIFRYLILKYTYGQGARAGESGIPNSRYWLDHYTRFSKSPDFQVPYLQLDENSVADALKLMEVLGYTETWVDELGRIVYRHPPWGDDRLTDPNRAVYRLSTNELRSWDLNRTDVDCSTYFEVTPSANPGIDSATAQALLAGRAPVPSSYLSSATAQLQQVVSPEFVIETDSHGQPTARGQQNPWYRLQRRLGVRPQQIDSPLLATQAQAQAQAEGLLRFYTRMSKGGTVTIPGDPRVRLGYELLLHGELDGIAINRTFYIEGVQHTLVWGQSYDTTLTLTHGKDPWDHGWRQIALPRFDPASLADPSGGGGVLDPAATPSAPAGGEGAEGNGVAVDAKGVRATTAVSSHLTRWHNPGGGIVWIASWMVDQLTFARKTGRWNGVILEGWRSYKTEQGYIDDGHHTPGVNVASSATASNHSRVTYPGGAIDTSDPAGLQNALAQWTGTPAAIIGNGVGLPGDVPHFSVDGH